MIGKTEWFARRKYTGWGLTPKTWQGWIYIVAMIAPLIVFQAMPQWSTEIRVAVTFMWFAVFGADVLDIMIHLKIDEREKLHEALAERNAAWFMVVVLAVGLAYELTANATVGRIYVNPFIAIALFGALVIKAFSNAYLEKNS
jgi:cobalamin synthase